MIIKRWEEGYRRVAAGVGDAVKRIAVGVGGGIIPTPLPKYVPRGTFCYYTIYNKV